jgi:anaerobic magnesium-protoporphyrin IX monomethyl ester cyclase
MKILFIIPPEHIYLEASAHEVVDRQREHRPNLGILYVASYLEKMRPHYEVKVIDAASECYSFTELAGFIREYRPDLVGVTSLTFTLLNALAVARLVKTVDPNIWVALGGWHPTYYPRETLQQPGVDLVVIGEGEVTFAEVADRLHDDLERPALRGLAGMAFKEANGEIVVNPARPLIPNLDEIPLPNYHLVNIRSYQHILGKSPVNLAIQSSRGCPFGCTFCDIRRSRFRQRSTESVIDEIRRWYRQGVRSFFFTDDNFVLDKSWTLTTCERMARENWQIDFKISARVDLPDLEMYRAIQRAGGSRVNFGVESSQQVNLDFLNKGITPEQTAEAFRLAHRAGLKGFAYMIIGFPHQDKWEMYRELLFLQKIKADYATFAVLSPYPKTALHLRLLREGEFATDFWQDFAEHPRADFIMPTVSKKYTPEQLRGIQVRLTQIFYLNPFFVGRIALSLRNLDQVKKLSRMAWTLALGKQSRS